MSAKLIRRLVIVALMGAVGYGAYQLANPPQTEEDLFVENGQQDLEARFDAYVDLRLKDDWPQIFEMVDPVEREEIDLGSFLGVYGQGVMKTHESVKRDVDINFNTRQARVSVRTEGELQVSKLPAQFRGSLRVDSPEDLKQSMEHDINWVWRDGQWYWSLEQEFVSGSTEDGRTVTPIAEQQG